MGEMTCRSFGLYKDPGSRRSRKSLSPSMALVALHIFLGVCLASAQAWALEHMTWMDESFGVIERLEK